MRKKHVCKLFVCFLLFTLAACNGGMNEEGQQQGDPMAFEEEQFNISSDQTSIPSDEFPHTRAILVDPAQYIHVEVEREEQHGQFPEGTFPEGLLPQPGENGQEQQPDQGQQPDQEQQPETEQGEQDQQPEEAEQPEQEEQPQEEGIGQSEQQVIELTNAERVNNGLPELEMDPSLSDVAQEKSDDMQQNGYFSHTSPTYGSPFDMIRDMGVDYNAAAENIAQGQQTPDQVVQSWMESEGHRQNILNGNFTHIGVGYNENGHYWTQMFISR